MRRHLLIYGTAVLALLLTGAAGLAYAHGLGPQRLSAPLASLGSTFTYQGLLTSNGAPVSDTCDFRFSLWDAESGGTPIGTTLDRNGVTVSEGRFTVQLDFGEVFDGTALWLEVAVKCSGDADYTTLTPRQALTPVPYAHYARQGPFWSLTGNAGTRPGTNLLGTTDGVSLTLGVSNTVGWRMEPTSGTPNIIGGYAGNGPITTTVGVFIGGGGRAGASNVAGADYVAIGGGEHISATGYAATVAGGSWITATGDYAAIGGGLHNTTGREYATVGGGYRNSASGPYNTVAGGRANTAADWYSTVGGGFHNTAQGYYATVGGGTYNSTAASYATVGGGYSNLASGQYATTPGGYDNTAQGDYSFAAGYRARANHQGSFVWADSTDADFTSNATDEFAVRAYGGVRLVTNGAGATVDGNAIWHEGNDGSGSGLDADTLDGYHASQLGSSHTHDHSSLTGLANDDHPQYFHLDQDETVNGRPAFNGGTSGVSPPFTVDSTYLVANLNADRLDGYHAGNSNGNIPLNNGTLNANLNADMLDGQHASAFASASHSHWGETWTGTGTGLSLSGGSRGLYGSGSTYGVHGYSTSSNPTYAGVYGTASAAHGVLGDTNAGGRAGVKGIGNNGTSDSPAGPTGIWGTSDSGYGGFFSNSSTTYPALWVRNQGTGGDLIVAYGTSSSDPEFRVTNSGDVYADGTYYCGQSIDDNAGTLDETELSPCLVDSTPADFAEVLPAETDLEPGDVLVIGPDGRLVRSTTPYDPAVAGVYSTRPSYVGGAANLDQAGFAPLAVMGIVPVKASAENGPINPGDLLTTSSTPGHAMKASPVTVNGVTFYPSGVILGKALEGLQEGTGTILMLVMLQ